MTIQKSLDTYNIEDTLQNYYVKGQLSVDQQGIKSISLALLEENIDDSEPLVLMNYSDQTSIADSSIYIRGDQSLIIMFSNYVASNLSTILNTVQQS